MTRRALLAAAGLTLIAGCATEERPVIRRLKAGAGSGPAGPAPGGTPSLGPAGPSGGHRPGHAGTLAGAGRPMYYIHGGPKVIALTIDDGPSPVYTPQILRLLEKYRVTAAFSMVGVHVERYPGVARDVAAAGHAIMNHTWQHLDLPVLPAAAALAQMDQATEAIHQVTGRAPAYFRAPYGAWSRQVFRHCQATGMTPVDWSVDPRDWARPGTSSIIGNILRNTQTGSIILEHDGGGDRSQTVAALKAVIPRLLDAGYHFRAL